MKTILSLIIVVALGVLAWYFLAGDAVPVAAEYDTKIVYEQGTDTTEEAFRNDCAARGGTFNSCGNGCAPDAEVCAAVCVAICELAGSEAAAWDTYRNEEVGYTISYREDMEVGTSQSPYGAVARFSLWGPTQEANTEFYDGVSVSIYARTLAEDETLEDVIGDEVGQTEQIGEVLEPVSTTTLAGLAGRHFRSYTVGAPQDRYYLQLNENTLLVVSAGAPDPTEQGYEQVVAQMLNSLEIIETEAETDASVEEDVTE